MMLTMIGGVITVVWVLVTQLPQAVRAQGPLPAAITLPDGARATAFTQGPDWYAVVTADQRILIFDRATGTLRQSVTVAAAP